MDVLADGGLRLCDAPRWHDGALWFSDLYATGVFRVTLDGTLDKMLDVDAGPCGLAFRPDGDLLVVSQTDQRILRWRPSSGALEDYADLTGTARCRANDLVLASDGTAYATCWGYDMAAGAPPEPAPLMRVTPDGTVDVAADGFRFPNALVLDPTERTLMLAETEGCAIVAFDRNDDGSLSRQRVWADLGGIHPDGMCADADGAVWAAGIFAESVVRVAEGGRVLDRVGTPGRIATGCMLGGPERRHLFVLTAEATPEQMARGEFHGRVEVTEVEVPGAGLP